MTTSRPSSTNSFHRASHLNNNTAFTSTASPKPRATNVRDFVNRRNRTPFLGRNEAPSPSPSPSPSQSEYSDRHLRRETQDDPPTGYLFDSSLTDADSTMSRRQMLEAQKLPVPLVGAAARKKAEGRDEKPMLFQQQQQEEGDVFPLLNFDVRDEEYDDDSFADHDGYGDGDGYSRYPEDVPYGTDRGGVGVPDELEYDDEDEEKSEDEEDVTQRVAPGGGLWDDTRTTGGMFDQTVDNSFMQRSPPPRQRSPDSPPRVQSLPVRGTRFEPPRPKEPPAPPFNISKRLPINSSAFAHPQPQTRQHTLIHHPIPDPDPTVRPARTPRSPDSTPRPLSPASPQPCLSDVDLRSIPTFAALLSRLQEKHASSRSSPPQDLENELKTLLAFAYPGRDAEKVGRMFETLPDSAYEAAGDIIVARKRELEEKMREAGRKRRRVVDARVDSVKAVAEDKVDRLEKLTKRREGLRGSVGRLLKENGFAVEF